MMRGPRGDTCWLRQAVSDGRTQLASLSLQLHDVLQVMSLPIMQALHNINTLAEVSCIEFLVPLGDASTLLIRILPANKMRRRRLLRPQ